MEKIKILSVNCRDIFVKVIAECKGNKYEGLLLRSSNDENTKVQTEVPQESEQLS